MNDMETEARRLLAAATEDMPSGIDLLGGFAAARCRDRARRTRGRVVLSAGVAMAAASVTAVALTIGSAPLAQATVTGALTRTLTRSYHLAEQDSSYYIWNGQTTDRAHDTCTIEADPARHLQASDCTDGAAFREVGGYIYIYSADPAGHPGKHWWRIPTASLRFWPARTIDGFTTATPEQMLSEIKKVDKVTVVGSASGPGWAGTRYAFSGSPVGRERLSGTVDVDQQGRARALVLTDRETSAINVFVMTQILTFSDFGARVTVTAPPADQTFSGP